jgi:hypothetical protein
MSGVERIPAARTAASIKSLICLVMKICRPTLMLREADLGETAAVAAA